MQPQRHLLAAESPPILQDDLIAEILSRLPVKSLVRFRCVCKSWNSLISDPPFVKLHLRRSSAKNGNLAHLRLLFERNINDSGNKILSSCSYNELIENPTTLVNEQNSHFRLKNKYRAIGTCNGLICFVGVQLGDGNAVDDRCWVRFWNPATRSRSPKSPYLCRPEIEPVTFGFGYDPSSDTYKVVALLYSVEGNHPVKVYNMGSNSWRNIPVFPIFPSPFRTDGIYLNGALIFSGHHYMSDLDRYGDWDKFAIVLLDLATETYTELSVPPLVMPSSLMPSLNILGECLCLSHEKNDTHFVVWQFGVDKTWTCLLNVSYEYLSNIPEASGSVLCMSGNGNVLLLIEDEVVLYDLTENRVELRVAIPTNIYCYEDKNYIESLVSPYGN
ncbi:Galactose oxidase/kelch, beta-propeller [Sesbania bispinosa]|nr:Galactose oxidase/kelch, beta-propeller [Sesbania bispinosa]